MPVEFGEAAGVEAELVAECMKNSVKWGRSECETWAPSKRRHHPDTALGPGMGSRPAMSALFARITAPTLVVGGRHDWILPPDMSEDVAARIPNAQLRIFEESGHSVIYDETEAFLDLVRGFLVYNH